MTVAAVDSQAIFEQCLRGELTVAAAADALTGMIAARKAQGADVSDLGLEKPDVTLSETALARGESLFAELNRRAAL